MLDEKRTIFKWFAHTANWFILFVRTYEEQRVAKRLQAKLDPNRYVVFVPTKDYAFKKNGRTTTRKVPWLSGYVFIAATVVSQECVDTVKPIIYNDSYIYKLLSNDGVSDNIELSQHDKAIMTTILDENFNISSIQAIMVGDKVSIIDGVLERTGGKVIRVNKHKQTAHIEIFILGRPVVFEIMLEFVTKSEEDESLKE